MSTELFQNGAVVKSHFVSTAGALHLLGVWSEGGKSFAEHNNAEFVLNYTSV